jgi:hypothetical protein
LSGSDRPQQADLSDWENGGSAWESNPLRSLILKDLRRFLILPILRFLSFAVVNPQIAPSENGA